MESNPQRTHPTPTGTARGWLPWAVALSVALSLAGSFIGSGALGGTRIQDAAGGWLSADATPLAPGSGAFSIWSVIYAGLVLYAVVQLLPSRRRSSRHARLRPWAALSALLNAAWIAVVQAGGLLASVVVIAALLAVLCRMLVLMVREPNRAGPLDSIAVDGTFGLYLGWVCVATVANVAAWLAALGFEGVGLAPALEAGTVLAVAVAVGLATAVYSRGRLAPAAALAWGLAWIAVGRLDGGTESPPTAWVAGISAAVVLLGAVAARVRSRGRADVPLGAGA